MSASSLGRILVVDDEELVRGMLTEYFTGAGYDVVTAASGLEALRRLPESQPDLVLLDVRMPGLDGVETLRRLREQAPDVAVIMITANDDVAVARDTLALGAIDYVAKPFDFGHLEGSVLSALAHVDAPPSSRQARADDDPWRALVHAAFRAGRGMSDAARASTGVRLEEAALRAARQAATDRVATAAALAEVEVLLGLAAELSDLTGTDLAAVQIAVSVARGTLPPRD